MTYAAAAGNIEFVRYALKDERFDPALRDCDSLKWAAHNAEYEVCRLLLQDSRVKPSSEKLKQIFDTAASFEEEFLIFFLLDLPEIAKITLNVQWALYYVCRSDHLHIAEKILERQLLNSDEIFQGVFQLEPIDYENFVPLFELLFVKYGLDPGQQDNFLIKELYEWPDYEDGVQWLLGDPRIDVTWKQNKMLRHAIKQGNWERMAQIMSHVSFKNLTE